MSDSIGLNPLKLTQDIQGMTHLKFFEVIFFEVINEIEEGRGKVHSIDVLLTSNRLEEIKTSTSNFVNDIFFNLDELLNELRPYLKAKKLHQKGAKAGVK